MCKKVLLNSLIIFVFASFISIAVCDNNTTEMTFKDEKTGEVQKIKVDEKKGETTIKVENKEGKEVQKVKIDESKSEAVYTKTDESGKVVEKVVVGQKIPENFRKDIPIYKNAQATVSSVENENQSLVLKTNDAIKKVTDFYKEELKKNGWEIKENQTFTAGEVEMSNFLCEKKDANLTVHAMTSMDGEKKITQIVLNVEPKESEE